MTCPLSLSLSVSSHTGDPSSGGAPPSTDSQPTSEDTVMDLGRTEVSDTSESSLHCTICSSCHSCPVESALSFAILVLSSMLLLCNRPPLSASVHYTCMYLVLRMVRHMVVIQCLDSFPFQFCSHTSSHVNYRWCCASCNTSHSCPLEPALSFANLVLSCMLSATVYFCTYVCAWFRVVLHIVVIQ